MIETNAYLPQNKINAGITEALWKPEVDEMCFPSFTSYLSSLDAGSPTSS
jgi:hypothetical protein